jgi:uncharacterized membrane protein
MNSLKNHLVRCFIAGVVAILPIAGLAATIAYFENQVAGIWLKNQGFYFFGLGLLILAMVIYLIGLVVSTFIGRWVWNRVDQLLDRLPILGNLYLTLKQILGYGSGPGGLFQRVVLVPFDHPQRWEIGLVTVEPNDSTAGRLGIFLPSAPTPTSGRFLYLEPDKVLPTSLRAGEAMQILVSMGTVQPDWALNSNDPVLEHAEEMRSQRDETSR